MHPVFVVVALADAGAAHDGPEGTRIAGGAVARDARTGVAGVVAGLAGGHPGVVVKWVARARAPAQRPEVRALAAAARGGVLVRAVQAAVVAGPARGTHSVVVGVRQAGAGRPAQVPNGCVAARTTSG